MIKNNPHLESNCSFQPSGRGRESGLDDINPCMCGGMKESETWWPKSTQDKKYCPRSLAFWVDPSSVQCDAKPFIIVHCRLAERGPMLHTAETSPSH